MPQQGSSAVLVQAASLHPGGKHQAGVQVHQVSCTEEQFCGSLLDVACLALKFTPGVCNQQHSLGGTDNNYALKLTMQVS
jgi:hypothetical protein